jgi:hypothetical protein
VESVEPATFMDANESRHSPQVLGKPAEDTARQ